MSSTFNGFPAEGREFLAKLGKNNNREWFQANKKSYEALVKRPAESIRDTLCDVLSTELGRDVQGKIFRINRDLRFSKDKTPYNCHVRMLFWSPEDNSGSAKSSPGAAFMLSIEDDALICGVGKLSFEKAQLAIYRDRIAKASAAKELQSILDELVSNGARISDFDLAKPPPGTDKSHPFPDLLRHKGLCAWRDLDAPADLATPKADQVILSEFRCLWPLYAWLHKPD
ncbi:MAG: DUF2461 domain-containing protein [Stappiaceae bacterium]